MATATWIGGRSSHSDPNDATDPLNWVGGITPTGSADTVIVLAGTSLSPVGFDLIGQPGTAQTIDGGLLQVAGTFDTVTLGNAVLNGSSIVAGDGAAPGQGFVLNLTDSQVIDTGISVGNNATLNLTGTTFNSLVLTSSGSGPGNATITQSGTASALRINAVGTANVDATTFLFSPGGNTTISVQQNGTIGGFYGMTGALVDVGGTLTINGDANASTRFSNAGFMLIDGAAGGALATLNARMNGISGVINLLGDTGGATLDVNTNLPGSQLVAWNDSHAELDIEAATVLPSNFNVTPIGSNTPQSTTVLQNFGAREAGFQPGDTIVLQGVSPAGLTYSFGNDPNYGNDVLVLNRGTVMVARLRFTGVDLVDGTGTIDGSATGNFAIVSQGTTAVAITLSNTVNAPSGLGTIVVTGTVGQWNGVTNGATTDWSAANWTNGTGTGGVPGAFQAASFALTPSEAAAIQAGNFNRYDLTVTTAETAGSVVMADPLMQTVISAPLTLSKVPGQSNGPGFVLTSGHVTVVNGGTVSAGRLITQTDGQVSLDTGGVLTIGGNANYAAGGGLAGIDAESGLDVTGGTITSGGNFTIGSNAGANVNVSNNIVAQTSTSVTYGSVGASVTTTYTSVGASPVQDGSQGGSSSLNISGPNTTWTDAGGDASTPFSGAMLVGGGLTSINALGQIVVANGGTGSVTVQNGATLIEQSYALLGVTRTSSGTVNILGNAQWLIAPGTVVPTGSIVVGNAIVGTNTLAAGGMPWLAVGAGGMGNLSINGGTVQLGTGEAFNQAKVMIGVGNAGNSSAAGFVNVQSGLLDTGGGPLVVSQRSNGQLIIGNGGTVVVGDGGTTADYGFGLGIGNRNGTAGIVSGLVNISAGGLLTDNGNIVVGRDSAGQLVINGGTAHVTGGMYLGGLLATNNGTVAITPTLFKGAGPGGNVMLNGSGALLVDGAVADMWQGSSIVLTGGADMLIGGGTSAVAGELVVAAGAALQGAGTIVVSSGDSTLRNFGTIIAGGLTSNGLPSQNGSTLEINAVLANTGSIAIAPGGALQLDNGTVSTIALDFGVGNLGTAPTNAETLRLMHPSGFQGTISDFFGLGPNGNRVDLVGAGFIGGSPASYAANVDPTTGGTVTVNTASGTASFHVTGFHPNGFSATADGAATGTVVFANDAAPCFLAGTAILTTAGERAVETLQPGMWVPSVHGGVLRRVVWTGQTRIDLDRHVEPARVAPIRILADAFAPGVPHRDLIVSPDHALWTGAALVPAYLLANGATIRREPAAGVVTYVHVELDAHDILLAEGLPAESYLETGNRGLFAGEAGARPVHADLMADLSARGWDQRACAVLALGGAVVAEAHRRLAERAAELGYDLSPDAAAEVSGPGGALAAEVSPGRIAVVVPPGVTRLTLGSRQAVPAELDAGLDDRRRLGLAVAGIRLDGRAVALDDGMCAGGFHAIEGEGAAPIRWTDGAAVFNLPPCAVARSLEITLRPGPLRYWVAVETTAGRARQARPV